MKKYNEMLQEIKKEMANASISEYYIEICTGCHLYGGTQCYNIEKSGAYHRLDKIVAFDYYNTISTISGEGNGDSYEIKSISKDYALKIIKGALKFAFSAPAFKDNSADCPADDDGMWWNNHRNVPNTTEIAVNERRWFVSFGE